MEKTKFFFSYAREDSRPGLKLARDLREAGVDLWVDRFDIRGGAHWDVAVEQALEECEGLIALLTPNSVRSERVKDEIHHAIEADKLVLPVLLVDCAIPYWLKRRQHIDFTVDRDAALDNLLLALGRQPRKKRPAGRSAKQPSVISKYFALDHAIPPPKLTALPSLALLDDPPRVEGGYSPEALEAMSRLVELKLNDFGVEAEVVAVRAGPLLTRFELRLAAGVKSSQVSNLAKDLARTLAAPSVRVLEIIPLKPFVGLEILNEVRELVTLGEIVKSEAYDDLKSPLTLALGKDIGGAPVCADLALMPHLLIAGTTGSGKSMAMNAMVLSLLYKSTPEHVRLIMIDPKMVEFAAYEGVPHLLAPVVTDVEEAAAALRWCVAEMERRYALMARLGARHLSAYNNKVREAIASGRPTGDPTLEGETAPNLQTLPFIVVIIDELAEIMMAAGKEVEDLISRLAQKARAPGIHMIVATQRPSVDVITGTIKANIPCRIAFQVSTKVDSRTILDRNGAEHLLGQGDMLYLQSGTSSEPIRVHGAFVSDDEVYKVVKALSASGASDDTNDALALRRDLVNLDAEPVAADGSDGERGPLAGITAETRSVSISGVPRRSILPSLSLLDDPPPREKGYSPEAREAMSRLVELKLNGFGIDAEVVASHPGPVVTRFELRPGSGVKSSQISSLAKDLARALATVSVRVVEIIPGRPYVGLEIPNEVRELVTLGEIVKSQTYSELKSPLTLALGKGVGGEPVCADLASMPHLLIAGTTGSGKSAALNASVLSLLYKATPEDVRLIMIDPKMVDLSVYEGIPHLLAPVVTDMKQATNALRWCVAEMERRYTLMARLGVRHLSSYNKKVEEATTNGQPMRDPTFTPKNGETAPDLQTLPLIVVILDEFADMMTMGGKEVEELIARLAKARAPGIHLIVATQRPSVDVITGIIKASIPCRIAFQVPAKVDSRTIIDQSGAECLLGHGDMLYLQSGMSSPPTRVHGAFVSKNEVRQVVKALCAGGAPNYIENVLELSSDVAGLGAEPGAHGESDGEQDPLYAQAVRVVTETRKASISGIQRRLKIGYNRAARMVIAMEEAGIVGGLQTNGFREVLAPSRRDAD